MESVCNMLRPLHFVLLLAAFAFLAFVAAEDGPAEHQIEPQPNVDVNDLEADATSYGYGGWGGYGRPWGNGGWNGRGGWNGGWRGGYPWGGGRGRGWNNWGGYWG